MTRLFGRGELKLALLQVAAELGPANGYTIMQELDERVGGAWRPSPGAIYPALLALEDAGLLRGVETAGGRAYEVTDQGRQTLDAEPDAVAAAAGRAEAAASVTTVGEVLDRVASTAPRRQRRLGSAEARHLELRLRAGLRSTLAGALAEATGSPTSDERTPRVRTTKETSDG